MNCKQFLRKAISLTLGTVMTLGILTGCSQKQSNEPGAGTSTATSTTVEKLQKVSFVTPVNGPVDNGNELQKYINTLIPGLEVEIIPLEIGSYWDLLNPRMAAGEIPDMFHCHNETMYLNYLNQGVLGSVTPETIKKNMPKYVEASIKYGTEVWSTVITDGKVYGIPAMDESQTRPFTNAWRGDWLEKVGITKVPETILEYEEALTKFTFNDPDGNGKNDTYGTTLRGKDATPNLFSSLFGAYGVYPNMWNKAKDGTLKFGITDPRAKEALVTLNKWFKAGLIDPEFTAADGGVRTEKWANSKIGMLSDSTYYEVNPGIAAYENLIALTPKAKIVRGPAPKGPNGDYGYINWSKITNKLAFGKTLNSEEGKVEKVLKLWEMIDTNPQIYNRVKFGEENINWKRLEDDYIVNIPPFNNVANRGKIGINAFDQGCIMPIPEVKAQSVSKNEPNQYKYAIEGTMKNGENYFSFLGKFASPEIDTAYKVDANAIYNKNIINFITGARSLNEYDTFVKEWNKAGGEAYTKSYNEVYKSVGEKMNKAKEIFK